MSKAKNAAVKSWRTTLAGLGQFLTVLGPALSAQFDNDPTTIASWASVAASAVLMVGLIFSRDNHITSEEANSK